MAFPRKAERCRFCGKRLDGDMFVELVLNDWTRERVPNAIGHQFRHRTAVLMTEFMCPVCAMGAVDRVLEGVRK